MFAPPRSTAQVAGRPLPLIPLPRHLQFHSRSGEIAPRSIKFKILCMPNTCRFQPYAWDTRLHGGRGAGLLRDCCGKNLLHFYCRGAAVAVWLDRAPDMRDSAGNVAALICNIGEEMKINTQANRSATRTPRSLYPIKNSQQHQSK